MPALSSGPEAVVAERPIRLSARGIGKRFPGVVALDKVDLTLRGGEVHALMGENGAGKTTLLKILTGIYTCDDGVIELDGRIVRPRDPRDAQRLGISIIHQELNQVPELSVYENFFLGRERRHALGWLDRPAMREEARRWLAQVGLALDPNRLLRGLRVAERQLLEIAKAISIDAKVLLMDEPTTALSGDEVRQMFRITRGLRDRGMAIVYISHRMDEVFEISDRITVLRDGRLVDSRAAGHYTRDSLITQMVGRPLPEFFPPDTPAIRGAELIRVSGLNVAPRAGKQRLIDINLHVSAGEVVGLAGLLGAGRTELLEAVFGVCPLSMWNGDIVIEGERKVFRSPRDAIAAGLGFVAEDRKGQSLALGRPVGENVTLAGLARFVSGGLIRLRDEAQGIDAAVRALRIRTPTTATAVGLLSGGNQQKVVFARHWLTQPRIFLLDEPTQGIDVGAKAEIYALVRELAGNGAAVLLASSDMPELLALCDRILVMCAGTIAGELSRADASQERILDLATRFGHGAAQDDRRKATTT
jgi:ribose transport system ATP-binding protein